MKNILCFVILLGYLYQLGNAQSINYIVPYSSSYIEDQLRSKSNHSNIIVHKVDIGDSNISSAGYFVGRASSVDRDSGIVITTGLIDDIRGGGDSALSYDQNQPGFPVFDSLYSSGETFDAVVFKIVFTPLGSQLNMDYVLASENYHEFNCNEENDWMGIFLRPDPTTTSQDWINLATVPGKPNVPVTPNTVNAGSTNGDETACIRLDPSWKDNSEFFAYTNLSTTHFDGFTKLLPTPSQTVIPGQKYELIIVVADGQTPIDDSAVFFYTNHFEAEPEKPYVLIEQDYEVCANEEMLIEGRQVNGPGEYVWKLTDEFAVVDTFLMATVSTYYEQRSVVRHLCEGEKLLVGDTFILPPATEFKDTVPGITCDTIVNYRIIQRAGNRSARTHLLCQGEVLRIGAKTFTTDGYYEEVIETEGACTQYILHHFTFSSPIYQEYTYNACPGDTIQLNGASYTESASVEERFVAMGGCDSVVVHSIVFDDFTRIIKEHDISLGANTIFDTIHIADTFFTNNAIYFERINVPDACDTLIEHRINFNTYEVRFGKDLQRSFCVGEEIDLLYGETYHLQKPYSEWVQTVLDTITEGGNEVYRSTITIDLNADTLRIDEVEDLDFIGLSMNHDWVTDLDIILTCPNGNSVTLQEHLPHNRSISSSGDNLARIHWSPYGVQAWNDHATATNYNLNNRVHYRTVESLDNLIGCPLDGQWTLSIEDNWKPSKGEWLNWSIAFDNEKVGIPAADSIIPLEELLVWSWIPNDPIEVTNHGFIGNSGVLNATISADTVGTFTVHNSFGNRRIFDVTEVLYSFTVTDPYSGPVENLDTTLCQPTFLYNSLITQSGTYNLQKQVPDYCTNIPVIAKVTIIPPDTTFLSTTTCEFSDSDLNIETLSNQYGCDSLIFTGIQLVVDTVFSQSINCLPNISTINRSFETLEVVVDNACDYVSVIEHIEVPIDTTYLQEIVCDPATAGVTTTVSPNQYGCDSIIITNHILALDTTYINSTSCQFEDEGIQEITLSNRFGCDSLIVTDITLEVDTIFSMLTQCNPDIDIPTTEVIIENVHVEDGCDYVSVQEILSAPIDTTYLVTPSCQLRDSLPNIEVLDNQLGCDSVIITSYNLRLDTLTHLINNCIAGITTPQQLIDTEWLIDEDACDTFQITITNLLPLDTTLVTTASCNPQDTGTFYQILPNQYLCDSLVITEVQFDPDTLYLEINTCYPQDSGWQLQILEQSDGCQTLEWTYRKYVPLSYDWLTTIDTCSFGLGSATFIPSDPDLMYTFEWDGPASNIDPAALFQGVYNVTITATGDTYPEHCVNTSQVIIGGVSFVPQAAFTYEAVDLDYKFTSDLIEADTFYWDFGDGNTSTEVNPNHTYFQPGNYTVCLTAKNRCDTRQNCQQVVTARYFTLAGRVETAPNFPNSTRINGVKISLSSQQGIQSMITPEEGNFLFSQQFEGYDYLLQAEKEGDVLNGLDISDLLKVAQAANGTRQLAEPYELLAADINCDAQISSADALYLNQLLLGQQDQFPEDCSSWIFWPKSYEFPDPAQPFNLSTDIFLENLQAGLWNNDFYGLKRGDLGANADAARSPTELDTLFLRLDNGIVQAGDTFQIDFRVQHFSELVGVQFEFIIDTFALAFHDIALGDLEALTTEHLGTQALEQGIFRLIWVDLLGQTHSLVDNDILLSIQLIAKQKINDRKSKMEISTREIAASYFNGALEEGVVQLLIDDLVDIVDVNNTFFQLGQNRPNPFHRTTTIPFHLSKAAPISLKVYSQLGQLVWQQDGRFPAGRTELEVHINTPGVYYYSIETPWGNASRKMVKVQ